MYPYSTRVPPARAPHSDHFHLHATAITLAAFLDTLLLVDDLTCCTSVVHYKKKTGNILQINQITDIQDISRYFKIPLHLARDCANFWPKDHHDTSSTGPLRLSCDGHLLGVARIHPQPQNASFSEPVDSKTMNIS